MIQTIKLTKYYGKHKGIENIDLTIKEGAYIGLVGPNGAGKSTLLSLLMGFLKPTQGMFEMPPLTEVGFMPSEPHFYEKMTVEKIINYSDTLLKKDCHEMSMSLCSRLQLDLHKKVSELSLGNKKKLAIVLALKHRPKYLILDEPTSGLDPLMVHEFYQILDEFHQDGCTIILSSHILSDVQKHCDDVYFMFNGQLIYESRMHQTKMLKAKQITLEGIKDISLIQDMPNFKIEDQRASFLYHGRMEALKDLFLKLEFQDIYIEDPKLEDLFMQLQKEKMS